MFSQDGLADLRSSCWSASLTMLSLEQHDAAMYETLQPLILNQHMQNNSLASKLEACDEMLQRHARFLDEGAAETRVALLERRLHEQARMQHSTCKKRSSACKQSPTREFQISIFMLQASDGLL